MDEAWRAPVTPPPSDADRAAIESTVRDYYEGWFDGDAPRMERALHPALAKRAFAQGPDRAPELDETTADAMVAATATGVGRSRGGDLLAVRLAEIGAGMASVNVFTPLRRLPPPDRDGGRLEDHQRAVAMGRRPRAESPRLSNAPNLERSETRDVSSAAWRI